MPNSTPKFDTPQSDYRLERPPAPTLPAEHLPDNFSEAKIFEPKPITTELTPQASTAATTPSESIFATSANPVSLEPTTEPQQAAPIASLPGIPKRASIAHKLISHPFRFSLAFLTLLIALGGGFMLLRADQQVDSSLGSQSSTTDEGLISAKDSQINLNFDTTIKGKLGIGAAPTGDADLQVAGDIQASGGLFVSGGNTSLSSSGLTINTITVCTASGCTPASTTTATTGGAGTTVDLSNLNASNLTSGTVADARLSGNVSLLGSNVDSSEIFDGTITNADINSTAAIAYAKLNLAGSVTNADLAGSIADSKLLTISTAGKVADSALSANVSLIGQTIDSAEIVNDSIVNADINSAAAIDWTKINKTGSSLADLTTRSAGDLSSGTLSDARLSANVTLQGNAFNGASQLVQLDAGGLLSALNGSALTNLNASNLASGTVTDARLSANVSLLGSSIDSTEITNDSIINADINAAAAIDWSKISKTGSSLADLTTRSAGDLSSGTLADARLSTNVTLQGNTFNGASQLVQLTAGGILPVLSGANLTNLNASNLASGTVADARLSANVTLQGNTFNGISQLVQLDAGGLLPALNGSALTSLNASNLASGTVADARLSANVSLLGSSIDSTEITNDSIINADINAAAAIDWTKINKTGSSLADLATRSAADLSSGTLSDARLSTNVTVQGNTFNGVSQLVQLTAGGILPVLSGANLTSLNASNLASGTVADARLSTNVTLQGNTFNGASQLVQLDAGGLLPALNGSALTNLNASNLASGTVADARLSANVSLLGQTIDSSEIVNDSIVNADINSLAAIAYSKLNLGTSIVNADIAVGAAIAYSKLNLVGAVTNADLAGSVADSKLLTISTAGKVADSALSALVTLQGNSFNGVSQLVQTTAGGILPAISGANLTSLNGSNISSGTVADARLSANVALLNGTGPQTFTGNNKFSGTFLAQNTIDGTTAFRVQNAAGNNYLLVNTSGATVEIGNGGIASTVQIGTTTGAVAQTVNIGNNATASSTNTVTIGNLLGTSTTNLQAGTGNLNLLSGGNIVLGTSDTTGTLLVLDTKTGAGDPACVDGGIYYNSNSGTIRACLVSAWDDLVPAAGWTGAGETWTYASTDDPTFTFTISGDKTGKYYPGQRIKLTQTTVKYFLVTKVAYSDPNTTVTIFGGTDYDLANAAISANFYSGMKVPAGFPLDPTKWTVETSDASNRTQASPANGIWYNPGPISMSIPIGIWNTTYYVTASTLANNTHADGFVSLSTSSSSESDSDFTRFWYNGDSGQSSVYSRSAITMSKTINLSSKTTYYLIIKENNNSDELGFFGGQAKTIIRAVSAYL